MCKSVFNADKMYTYIRGVATGARMPETLKALSFAREKHDGQFRRSGDPYIVHPLTMPFRIYKIDGRRVEEAEEQDRQTSKSDSEERKRTKG